VFALSRMEDTQSGNLIQGTCTLFDFGVTHSFISVACMEEL